MPLASRPARDSILAFHRTRALVDVWGELSLVPRVSGGELVSPFSRADGLRGGAAILEIWNDTLQRSTRIGNLMEAIPAEGRRLSQQRVEEAHVSHRGFFVMRPKEALAPSRNPCLAYRRMHPVAGYLNVDRAVNTDTRFWFMFRCRKILQIECVIVFGFAIGVFRRRVLRQIQRGSGYSRVPRPTCTYFPSICIEAR